MLFAVSASLLIAGCGQTAKTDEVQVPQGMVAVDLSQYGKDIIINVPDSTNGTMVIEELGGPVRISVGKNFMIDLNEGDGDIEMKKNVDIKENEVYKFEKFIVEEPTAVVYSWKMIGAEKSEFGFYSVSKIGEVNYEVVNTAGEIFTEEACKKMLESAKSIRAKSVTKKEA